MSEEAKSEETKVVEENKQKSEEKKTRVRRKKTEKTAEKPKSESAQAEVTEEVKTTEQSPSQEKSASKPKRKSKKKEAHVSRGKRKESIARASITKGTGKIRVNNLSIDAYYNNSYVREIVKEPIHYLGPEVNGIDIHLVVYGGGVMGQAQASRTAIANALVDYFDTQNLKEKFMNIDRSLLVEDVRRVESKKYKGPKARARYQKSYR